MSTDKTKIPSLFDHVNHVLYKRDKDYVVKLNSEQKKTFSSFMINRIISMDMQGALITSHIDKVMSVFGDDGYYKIATNILPKKRYNTFGKKSKTEDKKKKEFTKELIRCVKICYDNISDRQAKEYIDLLTNQQKMYILELYSKESEKFIKHLT